MIDISEVCPTDLEFVPLSKKRQLPSVSAVYFCLGSGDKVLYIGKATNIKERWKNHHRHKQLKQIEDVRIFWMETPPDLLDDVERASIKWFNPDLNGTKITLFDNLKYRPLPFCRSKSIFVNKESGAKHDFLRRRMDTLGWTSYRLAREVARVRGQVYGDKIEKFSTLIPSIERAIAAPERSSGKTLKCIVIALGGKSTIRWENKKTVSVIETVEEDF